MAFHKGLTREERSRLNEIDKGLKNKWNWRWLEEEIILSINDEEVIVTPELSIVKIDVPGKAECTWCHKIITYAGRGKGAIINHIRCSHHVRHILTNYGLGSLALPVASQLQPSEVKQFNTESSTENPLASCACVDEPVDEPVRPVLASIKVEPEEEDHQQTTMDKGSLKSTMRRVVTKSYVKVIACRQITTYVTGGANGSEIFSHSKTEEDEPQIVNVHESVETIDDNERENNLTSIHEMCQSPRSRYLKFSSGAGTSAPTSHSSSEATSQSTLSSFFPRAAESKRRWSAIADTETNADLNSQGLETKRPRRSVANGETLGTHRDVWLRLQDKEMAMDFQSENSVECNIANVASPSKRPTKMSTRKTPGLSLSLSSETEAKGSGSSSTQIGSSHIKQEPPAETKGSSSRGATPTKTKGATKQASQEVSSEIEEIIENLPTFFHCKFCHAKFKHEDLLNLHMKKVHQNLIDMLPSEVGK